MIYVVACGKEKINHSTRARQMYTGGYFKACLNYALSQNDDSVDSVYILSAKYGLVELDDVIQPYNLIMGESGCVDKEFVRRQVIEKGLEDERVIVLGGKKYVNFCKKVWNNVSCPLNGGMLKQIGWLNNQVELVKIKKQMELWK